MGVCGSVEWEWRVLMLMGGGVRQYEAGMREAEGGVSRGLVAQSLRK